MVTKIVVAEEILWHYETEEIGLSGEPIWVSTLSSH